MTYFGIFAERKRNREKDEREGKVTTKMLTLKIEVSTLDIYCAYEIDGNVNKLKQIFLGKINGFVFNKNYFFVVKKFKAEIHSEKF